MVQVRDDGGFHWVAISGDGEKREVWKNALETECQDLLTDLMCKMGESKMTLWFLASSSILTLFTTSASEIGMFRPNGRTNCTVNLKCTRGNWYIL